MKHTAGKLKHTVAHLGFQGSYSHQAATACYGRDACYRKALSFDQVCRLVVSGKAQAGILPIENTLVGTIYENYDLLSQNNLYITKEYVLKIDHCLLGNKELLDNPQGIHLIYSHPKALEQCKAFLHTLPHAKSKAVSDTAQAARLVQRSTRTDVAAIASAYCGTLYNVPILKVSVEDNPHNYTRFIVVGKNIERSPTANKCSIVVGLKHEVGSLSHFMNQLSSLGNNLTKIESRPLFGRPFEYLFYIDFIALGGREAIDHTLAVLPAFTTFQRCLGIYEASGDRYI